MLASELFDVLQACIEDQSLYYIVLSNSLQGEISKILIRPLETAKGYLYQATSHRNQKVFHSNLSPAELLDFLWPLLETTFRQAVFFTKLADLHLLINKKRKWTILKKKTDTPGEGEKS